MKKRAKPATHYTRYTAIPAEGVRVAVVTCLRCGAALLIDPRDAGDKVEVGRIHERWHEELSRLYEQAHKHPDPIYG